MATKQQLAKIAAILVEFQEEFASLTTEDGQWIIQHGREAASLFVKTIASRNETTTKDVKIIKSVSFGVMIEALDGKTFISQANKIFNCLIDKAFDHYNLNEFSVSTPKTMVDIYEISKGVSHYQMFNSVTKDLNRLVVTQAQIINFCEKHPDWLAQKDRGIYFVIKAHDQFFVVNVRPHSEGLCVDVMSTDDIFNEKIDNCQLIVVPAFFGLEDLLIDCDADPFTPEGWKVEEHKIGGQIKFDSTRVPLYLSKKQKHGSIIGNDLRKVLASQSVMNANMLDYLLTHPELIPEDWKDKYVFFWGTIYRSSDSGLFVRCLHWNGSRWGWLRRWLGDGFYSDYPAALVS